MSNYWLLALKNTMYNDWNYDFAVHSCTKTDLALAYMPDAHRRTAVNNLCRWIKNSKPLFDALTAAGYRHTQKHLTSRQVAIIVEHLGEP